MPTIKHTDNKHLLLRLRYYAKRYGKGNHKFVYSQTINPGYELLYNNNKVVVCAESIPVAQKVLQKQFKSLLQGKLNHAINYV